MSSSIIKKSTFDFLQKLTKNNNRDWFNANKEKYLAAQLNAEQFMDALIAKMNTHDQLETLSGKKSLYRIYNDVRFSKDKTPYNPRFAGSLKRTKPHLRGGYYLWIKPGASRIACGFSYPNADDLKRMRHDMLDNYKHWNKLISAKALVTNFKAMKGEQVKTVPRGFPADHAAVELLKFKQYWFEREFTDSEVLANDFLNNVNKTFKTIRPFFNYASEVLTTNLNGESLY